jgi:uncharacterized coiled-coil DUF342 family protein
MEVGLVSKEVQTLQSELEGNYERLNKLRDRKNEILAKLSDLQETAITSKISRDEKNKLIAEKKVVRDQLHKEKSEISDKLNELVEKKRIIIANAKDSEDDLVRELKAITWRYQTTTLSLDEDRKAVQQIAILEKKLAYFKRTKDLDHEIGRLRAQFNGLKDNANSTHREILSLADESKSFHEALINAHEQGSSLVEELNGIRAEMTSIWEGIQKSKVALSDARVKYDVAKTIAMQQKAQKLSEQAKIIITRRAELAGKATEKLKKGERVTFEEFGALLEETNGPNQ